MHKQQNWGVKQRDRSDWFVLLNSPRQAKKQKTVNFVYKCLILIKFYGIWQLCTWVKRWTPKLPVKRNTFYAVHTTIGKKWHNQYKAKLLAKVCIIAQKCNARKAIHEHTHISTHIACSIYRVAKFCVQPTKKQQQDPNNDTNTPKKKKRFHLSFEHSIDTE